MNIRTELLKEHSKVQAVKIASYACLSKKNFGELMHCFMSDEYRVAQRAAMSVNHATQIRPAYITPYIKELVSVLEKKEVHIAVVRNSLRILEQLTISEAFHGEVMNACFRFIETPSTPPAIKAFSLTTLYNLSATYPEIKAELQLIIEERWDTETAAFRSRGRKIIGKLKGLRGEVNRVKKVKEVKIVK